MKITDTERLDALQAESWDLRSRDIPTVGDDTDIGWQVIGHYMSKPYERVMGEDFNDNARGAIDDAIKNQKGQS